MMIMMITVILTMTDVEVTMDVMLMRMILFEIISNDKL